jgi:hypothetical protein
MQPSARSRGRRTTAHGRAAGIALVACLMLMPATAGASFVPEAGQRAKSIRAAHCTLKGARTIAANRKVRVFSARVRAWREVFGCRRSANRAFAIGDAGGECQNYDLVDAAVVSGTFAALNIHSCSLTSSFSVVKLVDLRDGRVHFASAPLSTPGSDTSYDAIRGMVLTPAGRLAWLGVRVARGAVVDAEVRRRTRGTTGASIVLDRGTGIDPRSLRRSGGRVRWQSGAIARSAPV